MRRKTIAAIACGLLLSTVVLSGCGKTAPASGEDTQAGTAATAELSSGTEQNTASDSDAQADGSDTAEENAAQTDSGVNEYGLTDGTYVAVFKSDNSMFHINEAYHDKGILTVENGVMTMHITLQSKNIVNLYPGLKEDAEKDGAVLLEPTTDSVTYSDGTTSEAYGFDIPVPVIDEEFDIALIGTHGNWYDHKVVVSDPVEGSEIPAEE